MRAKGDTLAAAVAGARVGVHATMTRMTRSATPPTVVSVIAGSQRSGTTWLAEMVNHDRAYRYCFEPCDPSRAPELAALHRRYLPSDFDAPALEGPLTLLFSGGYFSRGVDQYNPIALTPRRGLLVKLVHANLALPWITARFEDLHVVHVLRHPFNVARSRRRLGWAPDLGRYLRQPLLVERLRSLSRSGDIPEPGSDFEGHVLRWAIENVVPLSDVAGRTVPTVYYEQLVDDPEPALRLVFEQLGGHYRDDVLRGHGAPSATAFGRRRSTFDANWDHLDLAPYANSHELGAAREILAAFGLDELYDDDGNPTPGRFARPA